MTISVSANGKQLIAAGTFHYDPNDSRGVKLTYAGLNVFIRFDIHPAHAGSMVVDVNGNDITFTQKSSSYNFSSPEWGMIRPKEIARIEATNKRVYVAWGLRNRKTRDGDVVLIEYSLYEDE